MRFAGIIDFPLYDADEHIGYIPRPNQAGSFLNQYRWQVNEKSQGSETWQPDQKPDVLLIGDSIVWGGNPYDQPDKLGPTLARHLPGMAVWSAAAGSWNVPNEVEYMDRFPEVVSACEYVVWVLNSADLGTRSQWASELTHPRQRPISALWYVFEKYALSGLQAKLSILGSTEIPGHTEQSPVFLPETEALLRDRLRSLSEHARVLVVLWPDRATVAGDETALAGYREFASRVHRLALEPVDVLNLLDAPGLTPDLYRDEIHPTPNLTPSGNAYLATQIAEKLNSAAR
ncbi:MAG: hypothetical protein ACSLE5_16285 [Porticoccaceae bacterium]